MSSLQSLSEDKCRENTFLFCEASIILISKSEKPAENYEPVSLMNIDVKTLKKNVRKSNLLLKSNLPVYKKNYIS